MLSCPFFLFLHVPEFLKYSLLVHLERLAEIHVAVLLHRASPYLVLFRDSCVTLRRIKWKYLSDPYLITDVDGISLVCPEFIATDMN